MKNQKRIVFNTGRQYSDKGQRIAAQILDDGRVMFADVDRNIDGITHNAFDQSWADIMSMKEFVMMDYDYGRINYGSWQPNAGPKTNEQMDSLMQELKALANTL